MIINRDCLGVSAMWARITKTIHLTRGEKALVLAYAAIAAMSAGVTLLVMSGVTGEHAIPPEPTWYDNWAVLSGAIGGGVSLYLARNWMGLGGALGHARAAIGMVVVAFLAAMVAGTLILPFYGTVVGPFLMITEMVARPWVAIAWAAVAAGAHYLMTIWSDERAWGYGRGAEERGAVSQLSRLSQVNLYRQGYRR